MNCDTPMFDVVSTDRFPALRRLLPKRGVQIELVQQMEAADCGAACLSMALRFHGHATGLAEIRDAVGASAKGSTVQSLIRAAETYGLHSRGISCEVEDLKHLQPATILHWEFSHFVILDRVSRRGVHIIDPAIGRRCVPFTQVGKAFTGVAIEFSKTAAFVKKLDPSNLTWSFLKELVAGSGGIHKIILTSLFLQFFALGGPILTGLIVDSVVPEGNVSLLGAIGLGLGMLVVFQALGGLIRSHLLLQMQTNLDSRMTLGFLQHLVSLPYDFYQRRSAGDLLMRVSSNQVIREILTSQTLSALLDGLLVILYLVLIFLVAPTMAMFLVGFAACQVAVLLLSQDRIQELEAQTLEIGARSQSNLVQIISGIATLKLAGAEHRSVQKWSNDLSDTLNIGLKTGRLNAVIQSILGALANAAPMILLSYGALRVVEGQMSLGTMLAVNALGSAFLGPVSNLVHSSLSLQRVRGHLERIHDVLEIAPEQTPEQADMHHLQGHVALENVTFSYRDDGANAVSNLSLTITPGSSVAIVGASGSGKSTLAGLLLGLHKPSHGTIRFDGRDLATLNLRSLRSQMGVVPQEPFFFDSSVRENISLVDPEAPLDRVITAAKVAGIHEDILAMPMGYETPLADRGHSMSGGQRQRLALARALLARPTVLLLDEATSALDTQTEARVVRNLQGLRMTRIFIAHRLSTVRDADHIVVLDEGRIVETGSHQELVALGGRYAQLVHAQLVQSGEQKKGSVNAQIERPQTHGPEQTLVEHNLHARHQLHQLR